MAGDLGRVAVQRQVADRDAAVAGDVQAELDLLDVTTAALGAAVGRPRGGLGLALDGLGLVDAIQLDGGQVVVDLGDVELELLDRLEDQGGLDGRGVVGESLQGAAETVVVELVGGQAEIIGHGSGLGPRADADEGPGLEESVGNHDLHAGAPRDLALPGDDAIDGGSEVDAAEIMGDGGQCADDPGVETGLGVPR